MSYSKNAENCSSKLDLEKIACIIREYVKVHYSDFKFEVTTDYSKSSQSLNISLLKAPAYKTFSELSEDERDDVRRLHTWLNNINSFNPGEIDNEVEKVFDKQYAEKYLTERAKEIICGVEDYAKSFNREDCGAAIDCFSVKIWFDGVNIEWLNARRLKVHE